jgi:hypothetical protein
MRQTCNCPSCRGEGPDDDEGPEPSDDFIDEWIDDNRDEVVDACLEKIQAATGQEEPTDAQCDEWIDDKRNRQVVIDNCVEKIQESYESYLEGCEEEAAISRADSMADIEKDRRHDY